MKWMRNRFLLLPYLALLTVLAVVGCTSKQDPDEELTVCGNHSCGELVMVTTDTSSDGYNYLNPSLSPDQSTVLFSADWWAIPSDPRDDGTALYVENRQMILYPNVPIDKPEPRSSLAPGPGEVVGGELVILRERSILFGGRSSFLVTLKNDDKAYPIWDDDSHVIFSLRPTDLGGRYRICRADISNPALAPVEFLYMEPKDAFTSPPFAQHLEPVLSPAQAGSDSRWLAFTRSSCVIPDSFETCTGLSIWVMDMNTAGAGDGYDAVAFPVTREYSRIEAPEWSPDGRKIIFSGGLDVASSGNGAGTELFTIDFDTTGLATGSMTLDRNLTRLTFTSRSEGDPIAGILNTSPNYSNDGGTVYFVSTRRAPAITLHDRNIWSIPADGSLDPQIFYFTRADDVTPSVLPDGRILLSSALGFPTEMLNRLEEDAYQRYVVRDTAGLDEVQLRGLAADERRQLEFFEGVMSHIYIYRP